MLGDSHILERIVCFDFLRINKGLVRFLNFLIFSKYDTEVDFQIIIKIQITNFQTNL
jgi:hypothetical protein